MALGGRAGLRAAVLLAGVSVAWAAGRLAEDPPKPVEIVKPNVASDSAKAADAIRGYMDASKDRDAVWTDVKESKDKEPLMYPEHLVRLGKAQADTKEALKAATDLQKKA